MLWLSQWAFGVTLWELMTLGQTPYVDIDPFEMSAYLKDGYRIAQPINCPDELYVDLWKTQTHITSCLTILLRTLIDIMHSRAPNTERHN